MCLLPPHTYCVWRLQTHLQLSSEVGSSHRDCLSADIGLNNNIVGLLSAHTTPGNQSCSRSPVDCLDVRLTQSIFQSRAISKWKALVSDMLYHSVKKCF